MIEAIRSAKGMVYVAARQLNCSPNTIYNYASRYPTVQEAIDNERGLLVDTAELALWKALQAGEGWAISLVLKTLGKARGYVERSEVTGAAGGAIRVEIAPLPDDQLDNIFS